MMYLGTVMSLKNGKALVFTLDCSMIYIKARENMFVGQQVSFHQSDVYVGRKVLLWSLPLAALVAAAAILVTLFASGVFAGLVHPLPANAVAAYVAVDINPSVELRVDGDGNILSVDTLNDDAKTLVAGMDLKGQQVNSAVEKLISASISLGFLDPQSGVVMVAATVNGKNSTVMNNMAQYKSKLQSILQQVSSSQGDKVLTLFIEDPNTKVMADRNGLSIGRELLRDFAQKNHIVITDDELRSGKIDDLITRLGCSPDDIVPSPTPSESNAPSLTGSVTPSNTLSPTNTPGNSGVQVSVSGSGVKVHWDKASNADGFQYYKIVASQSNSSPKYPADGYAKAISNIKTTSATIGANDEYSGGDIGGHFVPGQQYYFSVTYVYSDHSVYGNAVPVTWPQHGNDNSPTPAPTQTPVNTATPTPVSSDQGGFSPHMNAYPSGDGIRITWMSLPGRTVSYDGKAYNDFCYYKVVASKSHSSPKYPDDGYIWAISNIGASAETVHPGTYYNGGDICTFQSGETYYFSITYVFDNGKLYANTVRVTMPGVAPTPTPTPTIPVFSGPSMSASVSEGRLHVSWAGVPAETFMYHDSKYKLEYYKIVYSETVANPKYPDQDYIEAISCYTTHSWSCEVPDCTFAAGHSYYISITYYCNNSYLYANTVHVTVSVPPTPTPSPQTPPPEEPTPSHEG